MRQSVQLKCHGCGEEFVTVYAHQRYCARPCRRRYKYLKHQEYEPRRYTKNCRWCGKVFPSRNKAQLACSRRCSRAWEANAKRDVAIARANAWAAANPERFSRRMAEARARRRARLASASTALITDRDLRRLRDRQRDCCAYCMERKFLTLEHVVPLARGGSHSIGNLLWICKSCNCSKRHKLLIEWRYIQLCAARAA